MTPFTPFGARGIFDGSTVAYFSYVGADALANAAEEVRDHMQAADTIELYSFDCSGTVASLICASAPVYVSEGVVRMCSASILLKLMRS